MNGWARAALSGAVLVAVTAVAAPSGTTSLAVVPHPLVVVGGSEEDAARLGPQLDAALARSDVRAVGEQCARKFVAARPGGSCGGDERLSRGARPGLRWPASALRERVPLPAPDGLRGQAGAVRRARGAERLQSRGHPSEGPSPSGDDPSRNRDGADRGAPPGDAGPAAAGGGPEGGAGRGPAVVGVAEREAGGPARGRGTCSGARVRPGSASRHTPASAPGRWRWRSERRCSSARRATRTRTGRRWTRTGSARQRRRPRRSSSPSATRRRR